MQSHLSSRVATEDQEPIAKGGVSLRQDGNGRYGGLAIGRVQNIGRICDDVDTTREYRLCCLEEMTQKKLAGKGTFWC